MANGEYTVKKWLRRAKGIKEDIKAMELTRKELEYVLFSGAAKISNTKVQTSKGNNRENILAAYADYGREIDKAKEELCKTQTEIFKAISQVKEITYRTLLKLRYLANMPWEDIAKEMYYSEKWVRTELHSKALQEVAKFIPKS